MANDLKSNSDKILACWVSSTMDFQSLIKKSKSGEVSILTTY